MKEDNVTQRTIRTLLIFLCAISSMAASIVAAQQTATDEMLNTMCGTWLNTKCTGDKKYPQRIVFKPDRTFETYDIASQQSPTEKGDFAVLESWKDSSGCLFCRATTKSFLSANSSFEFWRLNRLADTWESQFSFLKNNFAKEISPLPDSSKGFFYSIYFRQPNGQPPAFKDSMAVGDHIQYIYVTVNGKPLKAHAFQPRETSNSKPRSAIVLFHGGGWVSGEPEWAFGLAKHFASLGMIAVAVQYRLSDQMSITPLEAMADARAAVRWMRSNAARLRIDPNHIAAYGWSAGAHLAASAAIFDDAHPKDTVSVSPDALILVSPAVELTGDAWTQKLLGARADASSISPASHVRKGLPPTLVLQGRHDTMTPLKGVRLFCDRMQAAGNECDLQIYEGVGHLFTPDSIPDNREPQPDKNVQANALQKADEFLIRLGFAK